MRKLLACAALLCVVWAGAAAQDGAGEVAEPVAARGPNAATEAEAERLLQSAESRDRAWGAYFAGHLGLKGQAPRLVELLDDPALAGGRFEDNYVRQSVLDALIRLDAEVPADKLLPLYAQSPDEVVILLARSLQENGAALLSLFADELPSDRWVAVGNLLAEARVPGFAARLLRGLKIEARVLVFDSEGSHGVGSAGGSGCGSGCGIGGGRLPEGLPPVSYYTLSAYAGHGRVVVLPGRHPVYYLRTNFQRLGASACPITDRDGLRVEYLADLLNTTEESLGLDPRPWREVVCADERGCRRALAGVRDGIVASHAALLRRLVADDLLDPAEAPELRPDITLDVTDSRDRRTFPLPDSMKGVKVTLDTVDPEPPADAEEPAQEEPASASGPGREGTP
jgi:hypothetical protein